MGTFSSHDAFYEFESAVREKWRFARSPDCERFLGDVAATCGSRSRILQKGRSLWRSRRGSSTVSISDAEDDQELEELPLTGADLVPTPEHASLGRVSTPGIPVLYLANDLGTAIAEIRPWVGATLTVAAFEILRDLQIVNCSLRSEWNILYVGAPPVEQWDDRVWRSIGDAMSRPVDPDRASVSYAATQLISEVIRAQGFDGIAYKSHLGSGHNIALFNPDDAHAYHFQLMRVSAVKYSYDEFGNPGSAKRQTDPPPTSNPPAPPSES